MCTISPRLNVMLHFYIFSFFYIYTNIKNIIEQFQSAWESFFSVVIVDALNNDQGLIQI